jgi:signal transduction histidine kinase
VKGWRSIGASIQAAVAMTPALMPPPPLRRYQSVWRYAVAFLVGALVWSAVAEGQADHAELLFFIDPALGLLALVLLRYRRRWPFPVAMAIALLSAVSTAASGPLLVAAVSLSTRRRWREITPLFVTVVVFAGLISTWIQPDSGSLTESLIFGAIVSAVAIATGMYIGARRELLATLQDRAVRAEREQSLRVDQAQAQERARIAREMHDVLAHRISRIAMHAGALAYRTDLDAVATRHAAEVIQADAHGALNELRSVLGVLRDAADLRGPGGAGGPERPQPTLADLGALVAEAKAGGMNVSLVECGARQRPLVEQVGRSAYRIVQEGLTNAAKHAPGTRVTVRVTQADDEVAVEVRNRMPLRPVDAPPGAGFGLIGLTERTALVGGRLQHGVTDGEFLMRAWLPNE